MKPIHGISRLRARIASLGIRHVDVAAHLGIHPTLLSAILNGRREPPEGFEERVMEALDLLERAEKAAQRERERVLREGAA